MMPEGREVNFKADQIDWIVEHYFTLSSGRWPQKQSGYIDNPFAPPSQQVRATAYFEDPASLMAEFNSRIEKCGRDGELWILARYHEYDMRRLCRLMKIREDELYRIMNRVTYYVLGRKKDRPYTEFIRHYSPQYRGGSSLKRPPLSRKPSKPIDRFPSV